VKKSLQNSIKAQTLIRYLYLCKMAHTKTPGKGYGLVSTRGVQFVVCFSEKSVNFAGTNELTTSLFRDWRRNLDTSMVVNPYGPGRVHQGFLRYTEEAYSAVLQCIGNIEGPWTFSGHSQGAAIAALTAMAYQKQGGLINKVYCFAGPKFCDAECRDSIQMEIIHITNRWDPVPRLPLITLFPPRLYRRVGKTVLVGPSGMRGFRTLLKKGLNVHWFTEYKHALEVLPTEGRAGL
jgi:pimeloyl-ACP methyl ester carboxylesterase